MGWAREWAGVCVWVSASQTSNGIRKFLKCSRSVFPLVFCSVLYLTLIVFGFIWFSLLSPPWKSFDDTHSDPHQVLTQTASTNDGLLVYFMFKFYLAKKFSVLFEFGNCLQWQSDWYLHWCTPTLRSNLFWWLKKWKHFFLCRKPMNGFPTKIKTAWKLIGNSAKPYFEIT